MIGVNRISAQGLGWAAPFVGLPYRDHGRDFDGCDCWGLVRLVYRDQAGIELPSYDEAYASIAERREIAAIVAEEEASPTWTLITWDWRSAEAARLDIAVFVDGAYGRHVGIVLKPGLMLHLARRDCSKIESYRDTRWADRLTGIHRHASQCAA